MRIADGHVTEQNNARMGAGVAHRERALYRLGRGQDDINASASWAEWAALRGSMPWLLLIYHRGQCALAMLDTGTWDSCERPSSATEGTGFELFR